MSTRSDVEYFRGRALRERELARTSVNATVAGVHIEMAERYERALETAEVQVQVPAPQLGDR